MGLLDAQVVASTNGDVGAAAAMVVAMIPTATVAMTATTIAVAEMTATAVTAVMIAATTTAVMAANTSAPHTIATTTVATTAATRGANVVVSAAASAAARKDTAGNATADVMIVRPGTVVLVAVALLAVTIVNATTAPTGTRALGSSQAAVVTLTRPDPRVVTLMVLQSTTSKCCGHAECLGTAPMPGAVRRVPPRPL